MKADHLKVERYLKTARGQIDGILKMMEDDRYCIDISTQLMATIGLLMISCFVLKSNQII